MSNITSDNEIVCNNTYFVRNTTYRIKSITLESINLEIHYRNVVGEELTTDIVLYKSDAIPVIRDNPMVGKSFGGLSQYFGTITYQFQTYQTALKTGGGSASNYPLSLFYVFFNNHVYTQAFDVVNLSPLIGAWNQNANEGKISVYSVEFGPDGSVTSFINVTDTML